eukprot:CAMPEP_0171256180 /NCGR_PEP_ID=MMETSP0790-20130122/53167_1 /TAXON_ID=2925 /ORGANISM="Alexandrium catenella, Strain OF101" /LENGTH=68 /DNA_ID=CAMNT_0011724191 /DNA_START=38 /DNA_END=241 /DNA_ORIENTATION=+
MAEQQRAPLMPTPPSQPPRMPQGQKWQSAYCRAKVLAIRFAAHVRPWHAPVQKGRDGRIAGTPVPRVK